MLIDTSEFNLEKDYVLLVKYNYKSPQDNKIKLIFMIITRKGINYKDKFSFTKKKNLFQEYSFPCLYSNNDQCLLYTFQRQQFQVSSSNLLKFVQKDREFEIGFEESESK